MAKQNEEQNTEEQEEQQQQQSGENEQESQSTEEGENLDISKEDFEKLEKKIADLEKERNSERSRADKLHANYEKLLKKYESDEERREREKKEREEELASKEKTLKEQEIRFWKLNIMQEFGIPSEHEKRIHGDDEDSIREDAKAYKEELDKMASALTNERLAGGKPPQSGESKETMTYEQFKNLSLEKRSKKLEEDPELMEKLLKE